MSITLPNSPTPGQTVTSEGRTFMWTGDVWLMQPNAIPWATPQEAMAGTRADRAMSPALTDTRISQIASGGTDNPLSGTPTEVSGSRLRDVAYQNPFARPMIVCAWGQTALTLNLGATEAAVTRFAQQQRLQAVVGSAAYIFGIVPPLWWYSMGINSTADFSGWVEYR